MVPRFKKQSELFSAAPLLFRKEEKLIGVGGAIRTLNCCKPG